MFPNSLPLSQVSEIPGVSHASRPCRADTRLNRRSSVPSGKHSDAWPRGLVVRHEVSPVSRKTLLCMGRLRHKTQEHFTHRYRVLLPRDARPEKNATKLSIQIPDPCRFFFKPVANQATLFLRKGSFTWQTSSFRNITSPDTFQICTLCGVKQTHNSVVQRFAHFSFFHSPFLTLSFRH